ncbi:reverse transcriptase [Brucella abortus]|uniref:Uncharacterized protein n=2 Tax=Brucella abortus TaxID=235 RepID=Q2YP41_BRUA2|nr:hypothetical protein BruAb1_0193 [Brucella abortus bv. 1 str. 9-941]AEW16467.1 Phosphatidylglycerophosphate synthase [Brucella abortus A13334]ASZ85367.1 reverse transcriptase [Brucella abortus]CAJ10154.1 conserved hypothetical protein [Brucella abortus 2308]ASZ88219.1 reverse transcriptase [Brucella abortus]
METCRTKIEEIFQYIAKNIYRYSYDLFSGKYCVEAFQMLPSLK